MASNPNMTITWEVYLSVYHTNLEYKPASEVDTPYLLRIIREARVDLRPYGMEQRQPKESQKPVAVHRKLGGGRVHRVSFNTL